MPLSLTPGQAATIAFVCWFRHRYSPRKIGRRRSRSHSFPMFSNRRRRWMGTRRWQRRRWHRARTCTAKWKPGAIEPAVCQTCSILRLSLAGSAWQIDILCRPSALDVTLRPGHAETVGVREATYPRAGQPAVATAEGIKSEPSQSPDPEQLPAGARPQVVPAYKATLAKGATVSQRA